MKRYGVEKVNRGRLKNGKNQLFQKKCVCCGKNFTTTLKEYVICQKCADKISPITNLRGRKNGN